MPKEITNPPGPPIVKKPAGYLFKSLTFLVALACVALASNNRSVVAPALDSSMNGAQKAAQYLPPQVLYEMNADDWTYQGEGGKNAIFSYHPKKQPGYWEEGRLLRVSKEFFAAAEQVQWVLLLTL